MHYFMIKSMLRPISQTILYTMTGDCQGDNGGGRERGIPGYSEGQGDPGHC